MKEKPSMGPEFRKEPYIGICPIHNKKAIIWATYQGKQANKYDTMLTYYFVKHECELLVSGERCPYRKPCPVMERIEKIRYY